MSKRAAISADSRCLLIWLLAGIMELPLLALMLGWPLPIHWAPGLFLHCLAACAVFMAPPAERGYFSPIRHWGEPLGLITLLLPGFGWVMSGWLVITAARSVSDKDAYIFEDETEEDFNPLAALGRAESRMSEYADARDVIPAVDALLSDVPGLKRGAIETLSRIQTAESVGWIMKVRGESDPEARFYATTTLTRLKHTFETAINAAKQEVYQDPGALAPQISLQRVRYEYAISGMLDKDAQTLLLEECRARLTLHAEESIEAERLLFQVESELDPERAYPILDRLEEKMVARKHFWIRERAKLLFRQGKYRRLRAMFKTRGLESVGKGSDPKQDREWGSILLWWKHD